MIPRVFVVLIALLAASDAAGQWRRVRSALGGRGYADDPVEYGRGVIPVWELDKEVPGDCFTFARLKYRSWTQQRSWTWYTDYQDSDLNLSYRLHQLTAMRVDPRGTYVEITDPKLFDYPFLFMTGVGGLELDENEAGILRRYMLGGGFIMVDDFHGREQWEYFHKAMKMVFPDREPEDLKIDHPIFHIVYDLKEMYQVPNLSIGRSGVRTWESADWKEPHYCAIYDDRGRMVCFIGHNTDLGDGWEEEANDPIYFKLFSEPRAFPIGINVLVYAMTH